jgi:hypothetical protein
VDRLAAPGFICDPDKVRILPVDLPPIDPCREADSPTLPKSLRLVSKIVLPYKPQYTCLWELENNGAKERKNARAAVRERAVPAVCS